MPEGSRVSTTTAAPAWASVLLPSSADLIFVALLGVLAFTPLAVRLLGDAGIGWHIRTGQQILATHSIPRVDPFSSTMQGKPWFAWEWLYDVAVGGLEAHLGLNGVVWLTAVVIAAVFAWTFQILLNRGVHLCVALGLVLLAAGASMIHFLARPHVLTWLFTLAWFWILDRSERECFGGRAGQSRELWILPLLTLVWVNVHGGFLLGFALLVIFWLAAMWTWLRAKEGRIEDALKRISAAKRARDLVYVGLLSAAASFANPYGWRLHAHIYSYLSNRFLMDHIEEFQSPNFHGVAQKCFAVLILIALAVFALRRELVSNVRLSHVLMVLFAVYAGLYASRNIPVSSILLAFVIGPLVCQSSKPGAPEAKGAPRLADFARRGTAEQRGGFFSRMAHLDSTLRGHLWPIVAVVVTLAIAANGGQVGSQSLMDAHFDPKRMPVDAANYLDLHDVGPIFNPDYWGGYLIYRLYPKHRGGVIDDRHDLYGEEFLKSYLKVLHVDEPYDQFPLARQNGCFLLPKNGPLGVALFESGRYKSLYADDVAVLLCATAQQ
jgi:hypothetical protein